MKLDAKQTGLFIAKKRKEKKLTQTELADLLQVTDKAVSRWETGEGYPEISFLPKLATVLGCSIDDILQGGQKEVVMVDTKKLVTKFHFFSALSIAIFLFGYLINIVLIYTTEEKYWSLLSIIIIGFASYVLYFFQRYKYLTECNYTDEDKMIVFQATRRLIVVSVLTVCALLPQYLIGVVAYVMNQEIYLDEMVLRFGYYLLFALLFMIIGSIPLLVAFGFYQQKRFGHDFFKTNKVLIPFKYFSTYMFIYLFIAIVVQQYNFEYELRERFIYLIPIVMVIPYLYPIFIGDKKAILPLLLSLLTIPGVYYAAIIHSELVNIYDVWIIHGKYNMFKTLIYAGPGILIAITISFIFLRKLVINKDTFNHAFYAYKNIIFTSSYLFFLYMLVTNRQFGYNLEILTILYLLAWYISDIYLKNRTKPVDLSSS